MAITDVATYIIQTNSLISAKEKSEQLHEYTQDVQRAISGTIVQIPR